MNNLMGEIQGIMKHFKNSYINNNLEVILLPKTNGYFAIKNCRNEVDIKCKILENISRDCFKTQHYSKLKDNKKMWQENLIALNNALKTDFSQQDIELIYNKLGNGINHKLAKKFVESDFNMEVLK
jgi:hypothetical protein